uniref:3-oxo-5-alpha-steroid 4-dehydrogenase 2 isoform X1 n=2 Tax=Myxine glutinosa TaxID=7769 RepID=UPI003590287F
MSAALAECNGFVMAVLVNMMYLVSVMYLLKQVFIASEYGRYLESRGGIRIPARLSWALQELPAILVPVSMFLHADVVPPLPNVIIFFMFCLHYSQRTFIYALRLRGRPCQISIMLAAATFCTINGYLQSHSLLYCLHYPPDWIFGPRFMAGAVLFLAGMFINIHSDNILRNLRKPGESGYKIPKGGMFEFISGANFFGEIIEWLGYSLAAWSAPQAAFGFFTICSIGPRAYHHHRWSCTYGESFLSIGPTVAEKIIFILCGQTDKRTQMQYLLLWRG